MPEPMTPEEAAIRGRMEKATCLDCGLPYNDPGFADLVVPHDVWAKISPTKDENGLLCPTCMVRAAAKAGVETVATFRSGPFAGSSGLLSELSRRDAEIARLQAENGELRKALKWLRNELEEAIDGAEETRGRDTALSVMIRKIDHLDGGPWP